MNKFLEEYISKFIYEQTDKNILNIFINDKNKLRLNCCKKSWINSHIEIKNYLDKRYQDNRDNYVEILYRIKYNIEIIPKCPICKINPLIFKNFNKGYSIYCSKLCSSLSEEHANNFKKTYKERYGNYTKEQFKEMYNWSRENVIKMKLTCLEKYGVEYINQSLEIRNKTKQTCLEKYGVDNPNKCRAVRERLEETNILKYGTANAMKSDIVKNKMS